jgi:hypothetical protein
MSQLAKIDENATPTVSSETQAMMDMIQQIALNPSADVEKLRAVMDMKMEMFNRGAEIEFNAAMAAAQQEIEPVARTAQNKQTNSSYAKLENIIEQCAPIWTRHGFALSFDNGDCPKPNHYRVECEVTHRAGHKKHYHADIPEDIAGIQGSVNKTGVHAFGSTMSYGRRYLTCMIFNIALKNEDRDGNKTAERAGNAAAQPVTPAQIKKLRDGMKVSGVTEEALIKKAGVEKIEHIQQGRVAGAMAWLKKQAQGEGK